MNRAAPKRIENLLALALLSLAVGAVTGLVVATFRLALVRADAARNAFVAWTHQLGWAGLLMTVLATAAATSLAAFLVRRLAPEARGSGIPEVEDSLKGELPAWGRFLLLVKYVGGVLAIGAGLALGREGPSIQMGAYIARWFGSVTSVFADNRRALIAAGGGAGLAVAFNAPIAGAALVIEELVRRFDTRITIATLGASAAAITVARPFLGNAPDFSVPALPAMAPADLPFYLFLGVAAGVIGTLYSRTVLGALAATDRLSHVAVELRAGVIGAGVGIIAWFAPSLVGGGDNITQGTLDGNLATTTVLLAFVFRFLLGPFSYASGTPGGLFAPMLVLGTQVGVLTHAACALASPWLRAPPAAFAVVGMGAFFAAVVRAPLTGIVLVMELTGTFALLLPLLAATFAAMVIANVLGVPPIYDSLGARAARK